MTAPASNATVAGKTTLAADASDPVAVSGVHFLLDGPPARRGSDDSSTLHACMGHARQPATAPIVWLR